MIHNVKEGIGCATRLEAMNYNFIIVDDEPLSHEVLKRHLGKFNQLQLIGSFFSVRDAANFLNHHSVDLLFLDINMPEVSGPDFMQSLRLRPVSIITTAYRNHSLEGLELGVVDNLMKPVYTERLELAIKRTIAFYNLLGNNSTKQSPPAADEDSKQYEILIKSGSKKILVDYRRITYAQGLKDYTMLYTDQERYVVKGSVKAFESYLPVDHFVRVHKSFIVGVNKIKVIQKNRIEFDNISIPIGRSYRDAVDTIMLKKFGKK